MEFLNDAYDMTINRNFRRIFNISLRRLNKKICGYPVNCWNKPTSVQFDVTTKCNLDCPICPRHHMKGTELINRDMSVETFRRAIPLFPYLHFIWLHSYGEPFMNKNFMKILRIAKEHNVRTYFYTNGLLLNEEKSDELVELKADKIVFSIDGATKETYEGIRIQSNFEKVLENIRELNRIKKEHGSSKPYLGSCFVINRDNIHEMPEMITLANDLGIRGVFYQSVIAYTAIANEQSIYTLDPNYVSKIFRETREIASKHNIEIRLPYIKKINKHIKCNLPLTMMHIRFDGKVTPCPYCAYPFSEYYYMDKNRKLSNKKILFGEHILGDINKDNILDIWNNGYYRELRRSFKNDALKRPHSYCIMPYNIH